MTVEIIGKQSLNIAINPNKLKEGVETQTTKKELKHNEQLKRNANILTQKELSYTRSFSSKPADERTLLHLRDLFMGFALSLCQRSVLAYDIELNYLTSQAYYLFKRKDISAYFNLNSSENKGLFSTIAFLRESSSFNYPLSALEELMNSFWSFVGWSHNTNNYYDSNEEFLSNIFCVNQDDLETMISELSSIESRLNRIVNEPNELSDSDRSLLKIIRRNVLTTEDWEFLSLRLILSEYKYEVIELLNNIDNSLLGDNWASKIHKRAVENYAPYGTVGVYIGLIAQSYINIARFITDSEESIRNISLEDVINNEGLKRERLSDLPKWLLTGLDAASYLQRFNTIKEAGAILGDTAKLLSDLLTDELPFSNLQLRRRLE